MQIDDREVSWAAIAQPGPCHSMSWSDRILLIYRLPIATNKQVLTCSSTEYALGVAHNTSRILANIANFSCLL